MPRLPPPDTESEHDVSEPTPAEWAAAALKQAETAGVPVALVQIEHLRELLAERETLREGLRALADSPDAQEVVSTDGLRIGGESGAIVHNGSFAATHHEDLAAHIEKLLGGAR